MNRKIFTILSIMLFAAVSAFAGTIELPKTGQTTCYDQESVNIISCSGTGQDGDIQAGVAWPSPRFIDHGDGTVTDNLTGLMWTKNANLPRGDITWDQAMDYVADMNSGSGTYGYTDWRLPNMNELESLVNSEVSDSSVWLNAQDFTNVSHWYWSSTTRASYTESYTDYAWIVSMGSGYGNNYYKSNSNYVWPVRSGQSGTVQLPKTGQTTSYRAGDDGALQKGAVWPNPRFTDNGNGTVIDNLTGLMWTKNADLPNGTKTWQEALNYVKTVNTGGYTDWRLPNRNEMRSLCDYSQYYPALPSGHPFTNVQSIWYWSSTTYAYYTVYALIVSMDIGNVDNVDKSDSLFNGYVWPVRSGQVGSFENSTTTTASSSGDTTTTTTMEVTTTTTADTGICPVVQGVGSENKKIIAEIRNFRDKRLAKSASGLVLIMLYYNYSAEISGTFAANPRLQNEARNIIFEMLPVIKTDGPITLTKAQQNKISGLLQAIHSVASPELQKGINFILKKLEKGELLK